MQPNSLCPTLVVAHALPMVMACGARAHRDVMCQDPYLFIYSNFSTLLS
jgi:hypothetical protein